MKPEDSKKEILCKFRSGENTKAGGKLRRLDHDFPRE
jgi:hypothetical protein